MFRPILGLAVLVGAAGLAVAAVDGSRDLGRSGRGPRADRLPLVIAPEAARVPGVTSTVLEGDHVLVVRDERGRDLIRVDRARGVTTVSKGLAPTLDPVERGDACGAEGPCPAGDEV